MMTLQLGSVRSTRQNQLATLEDIKAIVQTDAHQAKIAAIWQSVMDGKPISSKKDELGFIIPTGFCQFGHSDATLSEYNGIVCVDLDGDKSTPLRAKETKEICKKIYAKIIAAKQQNKFAHVAAVAISPSQCGIKIFVKTTSRDKYSHANTASQAIEWLIKEAGECQISFRPYLSVDKCSKTLSQPHYLPAQIETFDAEELNIKITHHRKNTSQNGEHTPRLPIPSIDEIKAVPPQNMAAHQRLVSAKYGETAKEYADYLRLLTAYIALFGKKIGPCLFEELLIQSKEYRQSNFRKKLIDKVKSIHTLKTTGAWLLEESKKYVETYNIKGGQYLADFLQENGMLCPEKLCGRALVCPTGVGKTWAMAKLSEKEPIILAAPTRTLALQAAKDANGVAWVGGNKSANTFDHAVGCKFVATTYHSLPDLLARCHEMANRILVIDEAHNITCAASHDFMYSTIKRFVAAAQMFNRKITLTATPIPNIIEDEGAMQPIIFKKDAPKAEGEALIVADGVKIVEAAAHFAAKAINEKALPVIYLNDKGERLLELTQILKAQKIEFAVLNAAEKGSEDFIEIIDSGKVKKQCIITTSVIKEGVSIRGQEKVMYIICGACAPIEIQQLIARARGAKAQIKLLYKKDEGQNKKPNIQKILEEVTEISAEQIKALQKVSICAADVQALSLIAPKGATFNEKNNRWEIDQIAAYHAAFSIHALFYKKNPTALMAATENIIQWTKNVYKNALFKITKEGKRAAWDERKQEYQDALPECASEAGIKRNERKGGGAALAAAVVKTLAKSLNGNLWAAKDLALKLLSEIGNISKAKKLARQIRIAQVVWLGLETPVKAALTAIIQEKGENSLEKIKNRVFEAFLQECNIKLEEKAVEKILYSIFFVEHTKGGEVKRCRLTPITEALADFRAEICANAPPKILEEFDIGEMLAA